MGDRACRRLIGAEVRRDIRSASTLPHLSTWGGEAHGGTWGQRGTWGRRGTRKLSCIADME